MFCNCTWKRTHAKKKIIDDYMKNIGKNNHSAAIYICFCGLGVNSVKLTFYIFRFW